MKTFSILLIAVSTFILNIWLYYTSENYRSFLKNIKEDNVVKEVSDNYEIKKEDIKVNLEVDLESELNNNIITDKENGSLLRSDFWTAKINVEKKEDWEIILSDFAKTFLTKFIKYNLIELKSHSSLMDITSEYPDNYFEFYDSNLTIYFFPTKNYNEVREIFEIESDWKFFKVKELDNFWEESFYINLWKSFDDGFIRIILLKDNNVIWIKVSKSEYNEIKILLNN